MNVEVAEKQYQDTKRMMRMPEILPPNREQTLPNKITTSDLNLFYGSKQALRSIELDIAERQVTAFIGPSGCGKSTYLRTLNRMNDLIAGVRITGKIQIDGVDIYQKGLDVVDLRKRVGMVFQKSNPFPKSIWENVAYGPKVLGTRNKARLNELIVKKACFKLPFGMR